MSHYSAYIFQKKPLNSVYESLQNSLHTRVSITTHAYSTLSMSSLYILYIFSIISKS